MATNKLPSYEISTSFWSGRGACLKISRFPRISILPKFPESRIAWISPSTFSCWFTRSKTFTKFLLFSDGLWSEIVSKYCRNFCKFVLGDSDSITNGFEILIPVPRFLPDIRWKSCSKAVVLEKFRKSKRTEIDSSLSRNPWMIGPRRISSDGWYPNSKCFNFEASFSRKNSESQPRTSLSNMQSNLFICNFRSFSKLFKQSRKGADLAMLWRTLTAILSRFRNSENIFQTLSSFCILSVIAENSRRFSDGSHFRIGAIIGSRLLASKLGPSYQIMMSSRFTETTDSVILSSKVAAYADVFLLKFIYFFKYWTTKSEMSLCRCSQYSQLLLYRTRLYRNSHIPDTENFSPAQKQLTVCFVHSLVFGYTGFLIYRTLNLSPSQPQSGIESNWLYNGDNTAVATFLQCSYTQTLNTEHNWTVCMWSPIFSWLSVLPKVGTKP